MANIHYHLCPVCRSPDIAFALSATDHTVSHRSFDIWQCNRCTLRFTQDAPDEQSIGDYYKSETYISHTDTRKGLVNALYHRVRNRTLQSKLKLVKKMTGKQQGTLLDVGAGTGAFAATMKDNGWKVTGLEPDPDARAVAMATHGLPLSDTRELSKIEGPFDVITLWHVLEHVHALHDYINRLVALIGDQGKLMIAVPNYTSEDANFYGASWAAYDVPRHLYHFSPASMEMLANEHGLEIFDYQPMWYDSLYISLLSEKYKRGNSNFVLAGFHGVHSNALAMTDVKLCSSLIYCMRKKP